MNGHEKLEIALRRIKELDSIIEVDVHPHLARCKIVMEDEIILHIRYNDFGEYSYQIMYSMNKLDRIRFDNYDKAWDVETNPNHMHPRNKKNGETSPMSGDPEKDMIELLKYL